MAEQTIGNGKKYTVSDWNRLWGKSDVDLQILMNRSASKMLLENPGFQEKWDAESDFFAAEAILAEKKRRKENKLTVEKEYSDAIEKAYASLTAAYTPNGQLIVSILEEDNEKTADEIRAWYEELLLLEDEEYMQLLDGLVRDGVIYEKEGRYCILRTCEKGLAFNSSLQYLEWVKKKLQFSENSENPSRKRYIKRYIEGTEALFLTIPVNRPFYKEDLFSEADDLISYFVEGIEKDENRSIKWPIKEKDSEKLYEIAVGIIRTLDKEGLIQSQNGYYYVPLVGEL